jgi:cytochrome c peroxidase
MTSQTATVRLSIVCMTAALLACACAQPARESAPPVPAWEIDNPLVALPPSPRGITIVLSELPDPPTPERVRLGRWLFFDKRLSRDGTISCATCHKSQFAFSEAEPTSTGIGGQKGTRKAPSFVNEAQTLYPFFFWDGRAASLEEQALGPIANPIEMGSTLDLMIQTISGADGYTPYFQQAFGTPEITKERVAKAIADYERTRMSGDSEWDRWKMDPNEGAVSEDVKLGSELFFGKAGCAQCHLGQNFTDSTFHNLGIGWDPKAKTFRDDGRFVVTKSEADRGAFKTPTLRDVARHPPYMHDGSVATLRDAVVIYNQGGHANPRLDPKVRPLKLTPKEIDALVELMKALNGTGYQDAGPGKFPL